MKKKKNYNERVLQVENGTFTSLVFSTHGGIGRECKKFYQRLTEMIAEKRDIPTSVATKYIRTRMSFTVSQRYIINYGISSWRLLYFSINLYNTSHI